MFWSPKTHFFAIAPAGDKQPGLLSVWFNHFPATGENHRSVQIPLVEYRRQGPYFSFLFLFPSGAPILTGICSGDEAKTCESMSDEQLLDLGELKILSKCCHGQTFWDRHRPVCKKWCRYFCWLELSEVSSIYASCGKVGADVRVGASFKWPHREPLQNQMVTGRIRQRELLLPPSW